MSNRNILSADNNSIQLIKQESKAQPFGAHFMTKLAGVNSKLVCALSAGANTCWDDACGGQPLCSRAN